MSNKFKTACLTVAASTCLIAAAQAQVESANYDKNRVLGGSYYNQANADDPDADNYFVRNRYTAVTSRWQDGYDPIPVRLGAFEARPELRLTAGYDDNLFLTEDGETSDSFISIAPQITARTDWSRNLIGFDAIVIHDEYFDTSSQSATQYGVRGFGELDVTSNLAIGGSVSQRNYRLARSAIGGVDNAAERVEVDKTGVEANAAYEFSRLRLRGRISSDTYDYNDVDLIGGGSLSQDNRDRDETRIAAGAEWALTRDFAILGEVERLERDYDAPINGALDRDIEGFIYRAGANFELPVNIRGTVAVGYQSFEPGDPAQEDIEGLALYSDVLWFPTQLTTVGFSASRDVDDAGEVDATGVIVTRYNAGIDHELRRNIILSADIGFEERDFESADRVDELTSFGLGARWKLNRNVHLSTGYTFLTRESDFQPFDDNRLTLTLRLFP